MATHNLTEREIRMSKLKVNTWKCDACAEAECGSGLPCILTSPIIGVKQELCCPVSSEECEFELQPSIVGEEALDLKETGVSVDVVADARDYIENARYVFDMRVIDNEENSHLTALIAKVEEQATELDMLKSEKQQSMITCDCKKFYRLPTEPMCDKCEIERLKANIEERVSVNIGLLDEVARLKDYLSGLECPECKGMYQDQLDQGTGSVQKCQWCIDQMQALSQKGGDDEAM
jgi:hypothetical protein